MRIPGITYGRYANLPWNLHIASLCFGHLKYGGWFGLVLHTWGLRIGIGRDEIIVWFPWYRRGRR